jgi:hypothetical protein
MIGGFFVARAIKNNPALSALHMRSEKLISEIRREGVDEDIARGWAQQTFEHLLPALNSKAPKIECRRLLVEWALLDSDYKVMLIPPSPELDWTGLRGLRGISGELREHGVELAGKYAPIRDVIHATSVEVTETTSRNTIVALALQSSYLVNMANTARVAIDDYHHDMDMDWFRPMIYSFCVSSENTLRKLIGLPTSPDDDMAALMHSTMMHDVLGGSRFPDMNWRESYRDQIKRGLLSLPRFGDGFRIVPEGR